jgi:hypothetical protein
MRSWPESITNLLRTFSGAWHSNAPTVLTALIKTLPPSPPHILDRDTKQSPCCLLGPWHTTLVRLGREGLQLVLILDLDTRWGWVVGQRDGRPTFYPPGKAHGNPLDRRLSGTQKPYKKKSFVPVEVRTPVVQSPVRNQLRLTFLLYMF